MRTFLISLAATASALVIAAPASAQGYGNLRPAYGAPAYGYGYGYNRNGYGQVRALQGRVDQIQRQISHLAQYRMITSKEYRKLIGDSREVEQRLRHNLRDGRGLTQREYYKTQQQIARLEQRVQHEVRDGRQWGYRW